MAGSAAVVDTDCDGALVSWASCKSNAMAVAMLVQDHRQYRRATELLASTSLDDLLAILVEVREIALENMGRVLDLAATRASQVAPEQRLQHHHQRVAFSAVQLLAHDVARHGPHLGNRHSHELQDNTNRGHCGLGAGKGCAAEK